MFWGHWGARELLAVTGIRGVFPPPVLKQDKGGAGVVVPMC